MKSKIFRSLILVLLAVGLAFAGHRFIQWRQLQEKRKQLCLYFQTKSPVMGKLPGDAVFYANLFDLNRVHAGLQTTEFYQTLAHWLDTGMSGKQKANPMMGSMLEKTMLNVFGQEFGLALVSSQSGRPDFVAVSQLAPGSDFLIKLALAGAKNAKRIEQDQRVFYSFETKNPEYPEILVSTDGEFAYASSNRERMLHALTASKEGPEFLKKLPVEAIPEDTFLFFASSAPQFTALLHGDERFYQLAVSGDTSFKGSLPSLPEKQAIFSMETNGGEIFLQPGALLRIESVKDEPASTLILNFSDEELAKQHMAFLVEKLGEGVNSEPDFFTTAENQSVQRVRNAIIVTEGNSKVGSDLVLHKDQTLPLTFNVNFHPEPIHDFRRLVQTQDWSRFPESKEFYFLSCIKSIKGGINGSEKQITAELY
ncbi:MAG TPA: hypothetical protein VFG11_08260 [Acidobacteriota bacterium]|nr:hypothetical protein [Acidobacteriota bacterium]